MIRKILSLIFSYLLTILLVKSQDIAHEYLITSESDSISFMTDYLPKNVKSLTWKNHDSIWDLNGLKAPFIRLSIAKNPKEKPKVFETCNKVVQFDDASYEYFKDSAGIVKSYGISGINFFKDGKLYTGYYDHPRNFTNPFIVNLSSGLSKNDYSLVFPCELSMLPVSIKDQLPYQPDSIRIVIAIHEETEIKNGNSIYLNLQSLDVKKCDQKLTQTTVIETKKSNLDWQNVSRFVKFPKLFNTDTLHKSLFYTPSSKSPIVVAYYKNVTEIDKLIYKAPDTFKDLPIIEDFKPNLFFFPNPYSTGTLRCELLISTPGLYTLRIINVVGAEVKRQNLYLDKGLTLDKDLSGLTKGTYFITLEQDKDHVLSTKRLFVIKS